MSVRCEPPGTDRTRACARCAMNVCDSGVMILSAVPMTYQDGIVCHAAADERVMNALVVAGRWLAQSVSAVRVGRSGAKDRTKTFSFRYRSVSPAGAPG